MSHFSLLVVTDHKPTEADLTDALAPFQETEDNPDSKWDWWQIGGRWTGHLDPDYDPEKDERNIERCSLCAGTGKRGGDVCNGCGGTGKALRWPTQWRRHDGDQVQVKDLKPNAKLSFFACLRGGEWIERGSMGWFGAVYNEASDDDWKAALAALKASLRPDEWLTVVDCHI